MTGFIVAAIILLLSFITLETGISYWINKEGKQGKTQTAETGRRFRGKIEG